nr:hypothetical protein [Tanacetum cinerariifolium]
MVAARIKDLYQALDTARYVRSDETLILTEAYDHQIYRYLDGGDSLHSTKDDECIELKSMFEKQAEVEKFDLIQTFHACKQEERKFISLYVLKMKSYVEQLERLSYVLPRDISVCLILNGLIINFDVFVSNYNMRKIRKTIGELHALLIEYEKCLPKKATTPQVLAIQDDKIQKSNKKTQVAKGKGKEKGKGNNKIVYTPKPKNLKPAAKEHPAKDDACHHCKEVGHWR